MENNKTLLMKFKKADGKGYSLSIRNTKEDITEQEVKDVMDYIVANDVIQPGGVVITEAVSARITNTNVEKMDLVI